MGFGIKKETSRYKEYTAGGAAVTASTTAYAPVNGTTNFNAAENNRQVLIARPCNISQFVVITGTSQPASGSLVLTIRKNGVDTALAVTIPANSVAGTFRDTTDVVSFASEDLISVKGVNNATGSSTAVISWSIKTT